MVSPYKVNGVDLDQIFEPYVSGTKAGVTGYPDHSRGGVDLKDVYAPLYLGTSAALTNYRVRGADLNTIFAAKGSVHYALPIDGQTFSGASSGNVSGSMLASVRVNVNADGTYSVNCVGNQTSTTTALGNWLPAGEVASGYQVQFVVTQIDQDTTGPATFTNSAPGFTTCAANQSVSGQASVAQTSGLEKGGTYTIAINLKKISTGNVTTTTITAVIDSTGTG